MKAGRTFLVGSPRSGTTLLQRMVASHPALTSFPESHFLYALTGEGRLRRVLGLARADEARRALTSFLEACDAADLVPRVQRAEGLFYGPWLDLFVAILDELARRRGADGWIEKTPMHLHYVDLVEAHLPAPRFLHILRRGEEVVASVRRVTSEHPEAWGGERSVEACVERWLVDVERHRRHLGEPRHHFVLYDELVGDTRGVLEGVCSFLELPFHESMLAATDVDALVTDEETWKEGAAEEVAPGARRTDVERDLTPDELRYVRSRVESVDLSEFGDGGRRP